MIERRQRELALLRARYDEVEASDQIEWVIIRHFPLPPGWNKSETAVLFFVPSGYPSMAPDCFYADPDLRLAGGGMPSNSNINTALDRQWLWFSYHVRSGSWKPDLDPEQGHNLLTFALGVAKRFSEVL